MDNGSIRSYLVIPSLGMGASYFTLDVPFSVNSNDLSSRVVPAAPLASSAHLALALSSTFLDVTTDKAIF